MTTKKYYWLKMKDDFFNDRTVKKLRKIAGGDTYTIIYLKLLLLSLKNEGRILFEGVEDTFAEEMALEIDEETEDVKITISYLLKTGLMEQQDEEHFFMTTIPESIGSETADAARMRKKRAKNKALEVKKMGEIECKETNNVRELFTDVQKCSTEIEIEKEIEIDIEREKREKTNYQLVADMYNETCVSLPSVRSLSDSRKKSIKARLNTYSLDDFKTLFEKAEASDFLKGKNSRNWSASFDWLLKDANMVKVLEGNYDNKAVRTETVPEYIKSSLNNFPQNDYDFDEIEKKLLANRPNCSDDP